MQFTNSQTSQHTRVLQIPEYLSDAEKIVQTPTEILPPPSEYLDDKINNVNFSITTSFNSTKKMLSFNDKDKVINKKKKWPSNTILLTGDSILNNIEESKLSKKFNVKVRSFHGTDICDMYDYIAPLLRKDPAYIILHIGLNDTPNKSSGEILEIALQLKAHIEMVLPYAKVYLSSPIPRYDNVKAGFVIHQLHMKLKDMENVIQNNNVDSSSCIGRACLHLNGKGSGRLAMNYISVMRCL